MEIIAIGPGDLPFLVINIVVLYFILRKLLYRPLANLMENRTQEINEGIRMAEENRQKQEQLNAEYQEKIQQARQEARQIVEKAHTQKEEIIKEARKEADKKTEEMLTKARSEIEAEKNKAFDELRQDIARISVDIAGKIMEKEIDQASQDKLIQRYLEEVGKAS